MIASACHRAIDAVWRIESARIIASLARMVRDVGLAEELAQDALVGALEHWPETGVPDKPGAWLMAAAKHRVNERSVLTRGGRQPHPQIFQRMSIKPGADHLPWRCPWGAYRAADI